MSIVPNTFILSSCAPKIIIGEKQTTPNGQCGATNEKKSLTNERSQES